MDDCRVGQKNGRWLVERTHAQLDGEDGGRGDCKTDGRTVDDKTHRGKAMNGYMTTFANVFELDCQCIDSSNYAETIEHLRC